MSTAVHQSLLTSHLSLLTGRKRWVVPGSRLLPHVWAGFVMEQIREGDETRAKAACQT
jgi:hypothetical protein